MLQQSHPDWKLELIHIYTGIHDSNKNSFWHSFWKNKLNVAEQDPRVRVTTRTLKYSSDNNGCLIPREKGIDVKIALDLVRLARINAYDVAVLFSQDNDFTEVAKELRSVGAEKGRWIKIASAYPYSGKTHQRGIDKTDWIQIPKDEYDRCIDQNDYRNSTPQLTIPGISSTTNAKS